MTEQNAIALFKCLADKSRIQILKSLMTEDMYVERLAQRIGITPATVSFHLKKLEDVGAVRSRRDQYYTMYSINPDVLFGPAYKGIPLAVATTIAFSELYGRDIKYCSNRKEIKDHGDVGILLGSDLNDGDKVVIIEDVTTSGKSIEETFPILTAQANVDVVGLMVSLNRQERGKTQQNALAEIREVYGIETGAIVTMEEVVEYLYNRPYNGKVLIDDKTKAAIDAYYAQYGAK